MSGENEKIADIIRQILQEELKEFQDRIVTSIDDIKKRVETLEAGIGSHSTGSLSLDLEPSHSWGGRTTRSHSSDSLISNRSGSPSPTLLPTILSKVGARVQRAFSNTSSASPHSSVTHLSSLQAFNQSSTSPQSTSLSLTGPVSVRKNSGLSARTAEQHEKDPLMAYNYFVEQFPREFMIEGLNFTRVTHTKKVRRTLRLDLNSGFICWNPNKASSKVYLDRIGEIYVGDEASNYREELHVTTEVASRWVTIIHQRPGDTKLKALHMIMNTRREFDIMLSCLLQLTTYRREVMSGLRLAGESFVDLHWTQSTEQSENRLSFQQVLQLCQQLHVNCSSQFIREAFDEADVDSSKFLDFTEFKVFVKVLKRREDINEIWRTHRIGESRAALFDFVTQVQKESWEKLRPYLPGESKGLTLEQFTELLLKDAFSACSPEMGDGTNLNQPLNEYWISSSHNTYLMGRQVADASSVESCIRALQDGCRCLEIDCWDGPRGPSVYHGHSITRLTGSISFDDVIAAVHKYGFITSPYPIILSLEIRCSDVNQRHIVDVLKNVLGGLLVTEPLPGCPEGHLPSPADLRHRVLIKVKASNQVLVPASSANDSGTDDNNVQDYENGGKPGKAQKVIPELAALGVYLSGYTFHSFNSEEGSKYNHIFSFSEKTLKALMKDPKKHMEVLKHNRNYMSRVYPSPLRITSSNFDPIPFWKAGVQMVALNWQRNDIGMQLNSAFFPPDMGYVLKPWWLRPKSPSPGAAKHHGSGKHKMHLELVSAQQLARPKELKAEDSVSPYVRIQLHGVGGESVPEWQTASIPDNGFNPIWRLKVDYDIDSEDLPFACIRFCIGTGDLQFAFATVRVQTLSQGYRHLNLQDTQGEDYIFSTLFIRFDLSRHD